MTFASVADEFVIENGVLKKYNGTAADVVIPSSASKIGDAAFKGNDDIKTVTIPDSVKVIGSSAFSRCRRLSTVNLSLIHI